MNKDLDLNIKARQTGVCHKNEIKNIQQTSELLWTQHDVNPFGYIDTTVTFMTKIYCSLAIEILFVYGMVKIV